MSKISLPREILHTFKSLAVGLRVTFKNLFRKKVTVFYPEVELPIAERFRGMVAMPVDPETGEDRCIACGACMRTCPEQVIEVISEVGEDKKRKLKEFKLDISRCMWCGLCAEVCPTHALIMSRHYELAVDSRDKMKFDRSKLNEKGGLIPQEPKAETEGKSSEDSGDQASAPQPEP